MKVSHWLMCGLLVALLSEVPRAAVLQEHRIEPPHNTFDSSGNRDIQNWYHGGSTEIHEHFLRLTPDRQSKRGWLHSQKKIEDTPEWSMVVRFRISGQGKQLFGDGMAVWVTDHAYHRDGPLLGSTDRFTGFGVMFDTFRNTEAGHIHKDVSLAVSDGETPVDVSSDRPGCDSDFRFHEGRADFNVESYSAVKLVYRQGSLTVQMDPKSSGTWTDCFHVDTLGLRDGWDNQMYISLSSSTGQLADNHDIIAVMMDSDPDATFQEAGPDSMPPPSLGLSPQLNEAVLQASKFYADQVSADVKYLHHHLEHQLAAVHDSLKHTVATLQKQEAEAEGRIDELEKRVFSEVATKIDTSVEERITFLEAALNRNVKKTIEKDVTKTIQAEVEGVTGTWKWPFVVFVVVVVSLFVLAWRKYQYLVKRHLL
jgi:mannose-binding lectin 2